MAVPESLAPLPSLDHHQAPGLPPTHAQPHDAARAMRSAGARRPLRPAWDQDAPLRLVSRSTS